MQCRWYADQYLRQMKEQIKGLEQTGTGRKFLSWLTHKLSRRPWLFMAGRLERLVGPHDYATHVYGTQTADTVPP